MEEAIGKPWIRSYCKVGVHIGRFEACSTFTGYFGLSARRVAKATRLSRRLRRFRFLHRRSDSYRLERPSCRVRTCIPLKINTFFTAHTDPLETPWTAQSLCL